MSHAAVLPSSSRRRPAWRWRLLRVAVIAGIWAALALGGVLLWCLRDLPRPEDALAAIRRPSLALQDAAGTVFARFGDQVGEVVHLADLPASLPAAVVAIEDRRFWEHGGLDGRGLLRAAWVDLRRGQVAQGGSTLTQQLAKTLFLTGERSFRRKLQELILTLWLERHFSKAAILEIWLNRVYLGEGCWGVDAASRRYFGVPARRLAVWQAAMLAGLPRAPSRYNPAHDPRAAAARTRLVLAAMVQTGALTATQSAAEGARIATAAPAGQDGWFADWVAPRAEALIPAGRDAVLRTTLDPRAQAAAAHALATVLARAGARGGVDQGAVVVLDAATGAVRAIVGGRDRRDGPFNRAVQARRQPGSAFKPFVWLAALESGMRPDDTVLDAPLTVRGWSPQDFEPGWRGAVSLGQALALSLNTAAVRLEMRAGGPGAVAAVAHRLGVGGTLPEVPALALGTGEVSLLELTGAYAAFFNGGRRVRPQGVLSVVLEGGRPMPALQSGSPAIDPARAAALAAMLRGVVTGGTGAAAALPGRAVAGKTGTTQDNRDAWFVGAVGGPVGDTVIGVWLGNDDGTPMHGVTGGSLPAQVFRLVAAGT